MEKRRITRKLRGQRLDIGVELVLEQTANCMSIYAKISIHTRMGIHAKWAFMQR